MILSDPKWRVAKDCNSGHCVEVAELLDGVAIRDSKNPTNSVLAFDESARGTFADFLVGIKNGDFDDLI